MSLKVFVYGSGGREEAIRNSVSKSPLFGGFADSIENADLVVFGPEKPICDGLVDPIKHKAIGVDKNFSRLESSKLFAKSFMDKYDINNAKLLDKIESYPVVLKKDGLCGGKGVKIAYSEQDVTNFAYDFIEEYLDGDEISVMSLFDGKTLLNFMPARDFKRLSEDKTSPNTGGMGAYCPVDLTELQQKKLDEYLRRLEKSLIAEGADFCGFIYSGLIWVNNDWYVLEYNARLGDPEAQAILTHLETDFLYILKMALEKRLDEIELTYKNDYSACLTIAAKGYPTCPIIDDLIELPNDENIKVYKAGVKEVDGKIYSDGGRVLSLCTNAKSPFSVLKLYAEKIKMQNKYYRGDIDIF